MWVYFIKLGLPFDNDSSVFQSRKKKTICTGNYMFGRAIWDKLPECIFENFEIAWVKRGQFQNFQKSRGWLIPKIIRTKLLVIG